MEEAPTCKICGGTRALGGVFVAGVGPICFECEELEYGVPLGGDDADD